MSAQAKLLMQVLAMVPLGPWLSCVRGPGRPSEDRTALVAAFVVVSSILCKRFAGFRHFSHEIASESCFALVYEFFGGLRSLSRSR